MPCLQTLDLGYASSRFLRSLLSLIRPTSSLQSLHIVDEYAGLDELIHPADRTSALEFDDFMATDADDFLRSRMFDRLPSLTSESPSFSNCPPRLVRALAITHSSHLCPGVESISLEACDIKAASLIATIRSRTEQGAIVHLVRERGTYLRELRIYPSSKDGWNAVRALKQLPIRVKAKDWGNGEESDEESDEDRDEDEER
ncbi:hypothetical protein BOTBODRAFT_193015 [Botryobasidium botryosum FD-172 SS1]|uniref:F-box domain-containing protein n=1 Tax=Botryobasidium botryosum (strain FD-172 SS1) TaxID=930990 RepID=A0A067LW60_BOTB1|nr:hypothetical protein BOTBODRAFT_193015 [Botryobasidium botryosum FD-172 SS1]